MNPPIHQSITPPFFPARPLNGGPFDKALAKHGEWLYEPKFNGWRALVHVPTGAMFNRKLERLSIEAEFAAAVAMLRRELAANVCRPRDVLQTFIGRPTLANGEIEWADCEALERRHNRGRGSLIVLDLPMLVLPLKLRGYVLRSTFCPAIDHCAAPNSVYSVPQFTDGPAAYAQAALDNQTLGCCPFYEGVVAKRADSLYPLQRRSADLETHLWMKHRWAF